MLVANSLQSKLWKSIPDSHGPNVSYVKTFLYGYRKDKVSPVLIDELLYENIRGMGGTVPHILSLRVAGEEELLVPIV